VETKAAIRGALSGLDTRRAGCISEISLVGIGPSHDEPGQLLLPLAMSASVADRFSAAGSHKVVQTTATSRRRCPG
jgi:hypothetical protein